MVAAGSITVAVRVRPPSAWEAARLPEPCYDKVFRGDGALSTPGKVQHTAPLRDIVQIVDDRILTFDPDEKDQARAFVERGFLPPGTKRYKDKRFMFDKVFGHEARQQDVYEATAQPLLEGLFNGYNATVFAYGATGCGKTHTISGTETDPGIIYLTMSDLFQRIEDRRDEWDVEVVVTFLEIYNEEIRDLLAEPGSNPPRGGLSIREDKSVKVVGLAELKPRTAEDVKQIVLQGNLRRTQSPTHANETSSRSHAVLQVHVTQSPRTAALVEQRTMATLSIIDLAGSERAAATTNMGQRMVEGANINKSLLALGNCINALCESGGAVRHVPYRNSKLTRLLKFSLGGNCKTVMIVCVAPTSAHFDDTHNTLVYAERATKIKTKVVTRNVVNVDRHVGRYVEAINRLNQEIAELKEKLSGKRDAEKEVIRRKKAEAKAEVERTKSDLKTKVEQTKESIVDGATCTGIIAVAKAKLHAIRARLAQIDAKASSGPLTADLEAERALLKALAVPEEQATKADSPLVTRIQRASNSSAMFDATLRAVSERKSDKLDEVSVENVKLDAMCRKAEMDKAKAEGERDVMRSAVESMAEVVVSLVGMLGRCTVMIGEAAATLGGPSEGSSEIITVKVAKALDSLKKNNDEVFDKLVVDMRPPLPEGSAPDPLCFSMTPHPQRAQGGLLQLEPICQFRNLAALTVPLANRCVQV
ncbi:putative TRAFAC class myosin-kinesin ATPase superfamily protein [Lyophyllum shimeji]|uniref:Kinesin-like protein n=1 Tax=Lyophyllum shimeji TaxID=47721 RepID=A0A9P3PCQ2_LYOSH|nr:putative TRAFAC class myosin-kinesin ATPase superfamily protein [Lyophyllum shimeji]